MKYGNGFTMESVREYDMRQLQIQLQSDQIEQKQKRDAAFKTLCIGVGFVAVQIAFALVRR